MPDKRSYHKTLRGNWWSALTHPNFSKLSSSQPFVQLEGFSWDFPGILFPWLLGFGTDAGVSEWLTQSISLLCKKKTNTSHLWTCLHMLVKGLWPTLMQTLIHKAGKGFELVAMTMSFLITLRGYINALNVFKVILCYVSQTKDTRKTSDILFLHLSVSYHRPQCKAKSFHSDFIWKNTLSITKRVLRLL